MADEPLPYPGAASAPPVPAKHGPKSSVARWTIQCLLLLAFVVATLVSWYVIARVRDTRAIHKLEANARREGKPLSATDLAKLYPPIHSELNAAIPLLDAWEKEHPAFWSAFRRGERPLPERPGADINPDIPYLTGSRRKLFPGEELTTEETDAIQAFIESRAGRIDAVRAGISRPQCHFPIALNEGFNALLPHLTEVKTDAQTLRLSVLLAADRGVPAKRSPLWKNWFGSPMSWRPNR